MGMSFGMLLRTCAQALGDQEGTLVFYLANSRSGGTSSLFEAASNPEGEAVEVTVTTGEKLVASESYRVPKVIKIDVEGAEEEVVLGLKQTLCNPQCQCVLCEIHFKILGNRGQILAPHRIKRLLQEAGFSNFEWIDSSHLLAKK